MRLLFNSFYYVLIAGMAGIGLLFVGTLVPVFGIEAKVVKSGSMEPGIPVGSLVVIYAATSYAVGDVVTFGPDTKMQIPTTHRIVAVEGEGTSQMFTTKGDANEEQDNTATRVDEIIGKVLFDVPYLGYLLAFARTPLGFGLLVGVPAFMVMLEEGYVIIRELMALRLRRLSIRASRRKSSPPAVGASPVRATAHTKAVVRKGVAFDGIHRPVERTTVVRYTRIPIKHLAESTLGVLLLFGFVTLGTVGDTVSYFADAEASVGNKLQAGTWAPPEALRLFSAEVFDESLVDEYISITEDAPPEAPPTEEETVKDKTVTTETVESEPEKEEPRQEESVQIE